MCNPVTFVLMALLPSLRTWCIILLFFVNARSLWLMRQVSVHGARPTQRQHCKLEEYSWHLHSSCIYRVLICSHSPPMPAPLFPSLSLLLPCCTLRWQLSRHYNDKSSASFMQEKTGCLLQPTGMIIAGTEGLAFCADAVAAMISKNGC